MVYNFYKRRVSEELLIAVLILFRPGTNMHLRGLEHKRTAILTTSTKTFCDPVTQIVVSAGHEGCFSGRMLTEAPWKTRKSHSNQHSGLHTV